jgi:pyridoxine 4-dehydrogenase
MSRAARVTAAAAGSIAIGGSLPVSRLGFGAMRLTGPRVWGMPADRQAAAQVLREAVELGVTFIDTADSYGPGANERLIAEALHPYPPGLVVATKAGYVRPSPDRWAPDARPDHLRRACERSLVRLRMEALPLYQLHCVDPAVPLEESVGALADLQRAGKVVHVGLSNVDAPQLRRAQGIVQVVSVQNRCHVGDRSSDEVLAACERDGLAFIPWFPLALGRLAEGHPALDAIAVRRRATPAQVAIAWLLGRSPATLAIPGTTRSDHLRENVAAAAVELRPVDMVELDGLGD